MILIEFDTLTNKHIAFASNGILSIKHIDSDLAYSRLSKDQAYSLSTALVKWASQQPDLPSKEKSESVHW